MATALNLSLLVKLGSLAVHADELTSLNPSAVRGHEFDKQVIRQLLADPEVYEWLAAMAQDGYLPVKR